METKNIFTFKQTGDYDKHTLITNYDTEKAEELIASGVATEIDLSIFDINRDRAKELHADFKQGEQALKDEDNPLFTPDVKAYELDKLKQKYESDSQAIQSEHEAYINETIETTKTKAAQSVTSVSEQDKEVSSQALNRYVLQLAATGVKDKATVVDEIIGQIELLTDSQRVALQSDIPTLLASIDDESQRRQVIEEVTLTRNLDALSHKAALQIPYNVTTEYQTESIVRGWDK